MTYTEHLAHSQPGGIFALGSSPVVDIGVPVVGVCGGRHLSAKWLGLAARVGKGATVGGFDLATGCCTGADALIISASVIGHWADRLTILAAFGPDGAGANVRWWMGGGPKMPPAARLIRRTHALAAYTGGHAGAPMIGFVADGCPGQVEPARRVAANGAGSWAGLAAAAAHGRQIFVFWCAAGAPDLPAHWGGSWRPVGGGWLAGAWEWQRTAQPMLI
jgi:hypothetical protein